MVHPKGGKQIFFCFNREIVELLLSSGLHKEASAKNFLTAVQAFSNLFCVEKNLFGDVLLLFKDSVFDVLSYVCSSSSSNQISLKPSATAVATLLLKYFFSFFFLSFSYF